MLSFSTALELIKQGSKLQRKGWNGKGMYVYLQSSKEVDNKLLVLKNVDGGLNTWVPSITDILAIDWMVVL